jgi:DNA-directed RNA polymerase specialized sigma24 family protein
MDRTTAIDQLPEAYARVLRLRDQGFSDEQLATLVAVPREALGPLLRLAEAKLARLLAEPPTE